MCRKARLDCPTVRTLMVKGETFLKRFHFGHCWQWTWELYDFKSPVFFAQHAECCPLILPVSLGFVFCFFFLLLCSLDDAVWALNLTSLVLILIISPDYCQHVKMFSALLSSAKIYVRNVMSKKKKKRLSCILAHFNFCCSLDSLAS